MPKMVNRNTHPIRPRGKDGTLVRILPGQVVDADGEYADTLTATAGVDTASKDDIERWESSAEARKTHAAMPGDGSRVTAKAALGPAREAIRNATTVAPLQRVVGDSAAPRGPNSGTITTKGAAAASGDPRDIVAFGQGEEMALLGKKIVDADTPSNEAVTRGLVTQPEIHNRQTDARQNADAAARAFVAGQTGEAPEVPGSGEPIEGDYGKVGKYTSDELSAELARRGLPDERTKPEKVAALEADDAKQSASEPASSTQEGSGS